ncbi:Inner membrane amino-acid ABC transporter permease protein YecS [compost metagenome]|jgi:polar amino acid transport system permease protein|uniref:amino acid ABC transporter permease n=1 Tax=Pseudomonas TaxID=286 RepID=UPI000DC42A82|nr:MULTISPECIES: amino acid ABC transporter permease [Pseudomonas]MBT9236606.1 amino acid ABC transporter permease [Pseudomonas sp. MG-2]MCM8915505.1 amino acid ABC transporter permease [Pseudomonas inefficax]RAM67960.1 amino acid ABC transporter permease [Pseudomonas putida]WNN39529.1 amino acid ABC transporter permease [Pseudomonas inefficax]
MYRDHIVKPRATDNPAFMALATAVIFALALFYGVGDGSLARLMGPIVLDLQTPLLRNIAVAGTLAVTLVLNLFILGRFALRAQVITVWFELLLLFLLFFDTFDLSYSFIASKVGFMITQGVFTTVYVSTIAITIAFILALLGATARLSSNGFAIAIASFYTSFFRGVPLLIQIYLIYLGIPQLGYVVGAVPAGILALSLCYGAYMTEIFRAGISSIPRGQWEASRAIGLTPFQAMTRVILPQSMRLIIPPTGNQFISMLKDSSLVSVIGVWELMFLARTQGRAEFRHLEMLITAAVLYWVLSILLEAVQSRLEKRFDRAHR